MTGSTAYKNQRNRLVDINLVESSPTEPVTLVQVKDELRITFADDDESLLRLITACRAAVEEFCCISIVEKEITLVGDLNCEYELPYGPVTALTTAEYKTGVGTYEAKTANTDFEVDGVLFKTFRPFYGGRWKLEYTTGYEPMPADLKLDLFRIIAYCYEHKGDEPLTSLQGGQQRPKGLDEALELFAMKHRRMQYI